MDEAEVCADAGSEGTTGALDEHEQRARKMRHGHAIGREMEPC